MRTVQPNPDAVKEIDLFNPDCRHSWFTAKPAQSSNGAFKDDRQRAFGDEIVVVHTQNSFTDDDSRMEFDVGTVWRFREGKVAEVWEYTRGLLGGCHPAIQR